MSLITSLRWAVPMALLLGGELLASTALSNQAKPVVLSDSTYRKSLTYFFDRPARDMMEELPLGNGRLGMLSDGGIQEQIITLCESSMWSGSIDSTAWNNEAVKHLPTIRQLLLTGKPKEAEDLMYRTFVCGGQGSGRGNGANVP